MTIDIKAAQARLNELGFGPLVVDGLMGPRTGAAVTAFKRSIGFKATAYLGQLTWEALMAPRSDNAIPWMAEAIRMKGLHEGRDRAELMGWFDRAVRINPAEIPWCGAFVATCVRMYQPALPLPDNALGARNWARAGVSVKPQLGAILVFWRGSPTGWSGHVGFYWGEDDDAFHVLGGNQSDAVTVTRIGRGRLLAARWPDPDVRATGKVIRLTTSGTPLSTNEA
jgi:uncharacterized protein (TIGR02594 family)